MRYKIQYLLIILAVNTHKVNSQYSTSKLGFSGYISAMPYILATKYTDSTETYIQGIFHNRINLDWYPNDVLSGSIQFRNLLQGGELNKLMERPEGFETENYFLPLTFYQPIGDQYLLSLSVDRMWLKYTKDNLEITAGRQRINWAQTFAWNPNDLFNSYNFFEVDYEERPGADAIRIQYYTGMTSSIDFAAKIDSGNNVTAASLFRFNRWNYDMQLMAGYYSSEIKTNLKTAKEEDVVIGAGWSGDFFGPSFRGEVSYFHPIKNFQDTSGLFLMSMAFDYTFNNETYLFFEAFYNDIDSLNPSNFLNFYSDIRTVKTLSITKYNFVGQISYPVSPIFNVSFAGMYFFQDSFDGAYLGPTFSLSLTDNMQFSAIFQYFAYKDEIITNDDWLSSIFAFANLRWNF